MPNLDKEAISVIIKQHFKETETLTPTDPLKVRNSCLSGHFPGQEKVCRYCRKARFNRLTSGHYNDEPSIGQIEAYLSKNESDVSHSTEDYSFVIEYLAGLGTEKS